MDENNDLAHNAMCHVPFKLVRKLCSTMVPYDHGLSILMFDYNND